MIVPHPPAHLTLARQLPPAVMAQGVLIVDDSRLQRKSAEQCLIALGVKYIFEAANGQEALLFLRQAPTSPALMLLDVEMPVLDGIEVLQQLVREAYVPAIILLSNSDEVLINAVATMAEALQLPLLGAFRKPLHPEQLATALISTWWSQGVGRHNAALPLPPTQI